MQDYSKFLFIKDNDEGNVDYLTTDDLDDFYTWCHYFKGLSEETWFAFIRQEAISSLRLDGIYKYDGNDVKYYIINKREI